MTTYLRRQIADHRERLERLASELAKLERERVVLEAALRAYEDALAHLPTGDLPAKASTRKRRGGGRRGLSRHWKAVIAAAADKLPDASGYDAIEAVLKKHGKATRRSNLRRHMLSYVDSGYFERVKDGYFRPTEKGLKAADVPTKGIAFPPSKNETPDAATSGVSRNSNGGGSPLLIERPEPGRPLA